MFEQKEDDVKAEFRSQFSDDDWTTMVNAFCEIPETSLSMLYNCMYYAVSASDLNECLDQISSDTQDDDQDETEDDSDDQYDSDDHDDSD